MRSLPRATAGRRLLAVLALAVAVAAGCGTDNLIGVEPGSTADSLVFRLAASRGDIITPPSLVYGLTVIPCGGDRVLWQISAETGEGRIPSRVRYGEQLQGFRVRVPAEPLRPGCYEAVISGPATVRFDVRADGTVLERPSQRRPVPAPAADDTT